MGIPVQPNSQKDFSVAVVGGGVCGLLTAIGLIRAGIKIEIFEAASKYGEVGAGLGIGPNAVQALERLGLLDDVVTFVAPLPRARPIRFLFGEGDNDLIYEYPVKESDGLLHTHRATLLDAFAQFIDPKVTPTHFNTRCTSIHPSSVNPSRTVLTFSDGSTHETDLVIGADGIKSCVRNFIVGGDASSRLAYTNTIAYRGLIPMDRIRKAGMKTSVYPEQCCFQGDGKVSLSFFTACKWYAHLVPQHIITFPIDNEKLLNVVACVTDFSLPIGKVPCPEGDSWVVPSSKEEMLNDFKEWGNDPLKLLNCIDHPNKWYLHGLYPPLESFVEGHVALVGDAAHAMLPHLGGGVGQGIEDCYVIARLLVHPQTRVSNLEAVLQAYDRVRRPRANEVLWRSKCNGDVYEGHGASGASAEGRFKDMYNVWEDIWHHDLDADVQRGVDWLKEQGHF
ncbi:hypothetical protein EWM64_g1611 [Hericium alpestre]|uniref:FAD-binding domain-containing protein n=1 Tax=Hericium alpestre TaxID=135208 RepID=A0A4Z0A900_9AGAM|nr:hypothetical protein EWM64_g1611 [Hericium alpestre]